MASGILHGAVSCVPAHLLIFELLAGSSVIGLTSPTSPLRPLALPIMAASTYGVVKTAVKYMRPRWASLLGGLSFAFLLRYLDVGLITRWNYKTQGPTANTTPSKTTTVGKQQLSEQKIETKEPPPNVSICKQFHWGWETMWSFRQVNSPYEVRNSPTFSASDPSYVPSKWLFIAEKTFLATVSYLILDLLAQRPPPKNAATLFNAALIPFFRRLNQVTWPEIRLRAISIVMFGVTFYCVIQGTYSATAAVAVATGLSDVSSWRPPFGDFTEAYSLRNFWGKVWHQNLRRLVSAPASYIIYNLLGLNRKSALAAASTTMLSFVISGLMHLVAGHSSGMPIREMGVVQFFCTQAFGIILETAFIKVFQFQISSDDLDERAPPELLQLVLGYSWVLAFLAWSGPMWLYPQSARQSSQAVSSSFVPYSIVRAWKDRQANH